MGARGGGFVQGLVAALPPPVHCTPIGSRVSLSLLALVLLLHLDLLSTPCTLR
eukprot:NODE_13829_length_250_cov_17.218905_g12916_i0.p3 GENE.NODE_13829_length_250_cov_17.218905_g12916_i0~~NODE_13829_length_250_cov_17.218905_g12916_i0.p3  ORF type:complete len:53 (+),score=2.94 NODE_13829_length_250_cov_17.218905_g12916_i0:89-247(+)